MLLNYVLDSRYDGQSNLVNFTPTIYNDNLIPRDLKSNHKIGHILLILNKYIKLNKTYIFRYMLEVIIKKEKRRLLGSG